MLRGDRRTAALVLVGALTTGLAGCGWPPGYLLHVISGELNLLCQAGSIEQALEDPALSDEQRDKLAFVVRARDYAEDVVGLNVDENFRQFVNLHDESLAWNVSACRRDAFEPYIWTLPFAGPLPYLGYFDKGPADDLRDWLMDRGYDTLVYEVDAYAIPFLPDPITSALLERSLSSLADTVIHESLHNTIFRLNDSTFDESLATFVGRTAGLAFVEADFGPESPQAQEARQDFEDRDRLNVFIQDLVEELQAIYESELSSEEKIDAREPVFEAARQRFAAEVLPLMNNQPLYEGYADFPFNNAFLLANVRYNTDLDVFEQGYEMTGRNWADTLDLFARAAAADDPITFLRDQLPAVPAAPP